MQRKGKGTEQACLQSWAGKVHGLGQQTAGTEQISTGAQAPCLLSDRRAGHASGGSYTDFRSPGYWGLICSARLAFPSKPTQEPQCGRRSSYEVDCRLTQSFLLFSVLFLKMVVWTQQNFCLQCLPHKSSWIHPIHHCFPEQLKQQPKQGQKAQFFAVSWEGTSGSFSPILVLFLPLLFSFYLSPSFFANYFFLLFVISLPLLSVTSLP